MYSLFEVWNVIALKYDINKASHKQSWKALHLSNILKDIKLHQGVKFLYILLILDNIL